MMPVESQEEILGGGNMSSARVKFFKDFVQQEEDVNEHRDLYDAAEDHQSAISDHQPLGHPGADHFAQLRRFQQLAQRLGGEAQGKGWLFGDGCGSSRSAREGRDFAELFARTDSAS